MLDADNHRVIVVDADRQVAQLATQDSLTKEQLRVGIRRGRGSGTAVSGGWVLRPNARYGSATARQRLGFDKGVGIGGARVLFQGHDGVFRIRADRPGSAHLRNLLKEAIRQRIRVWFIAHKSDLTLLGVLPSEGMREYQISFVVAPEHLLRAADEILHARIRCSKALQRDIRAVAKAYIDEADELKRGVRDIRAKENWRHFTFRSIKSPSTPMA